MRSDTFLILAYWGHLVPRGPFARILIYSVSEGGSLNSCAAGAAVRICCHIELSLVTFTRRRGLRTPSCRVVEEEAEVALEGVEEKE